MKKLLLAAVAVLLSVGALSAQDSKKWYVSGTIMGDYERMKVVDGNSTLTSNVWSAGAGVAINRMLGNRFSAGLGVAYAGATAGWADSHAISVELGIAHFTKIVDKLYYVPEIGAGMMFNVSEGSDGENTFFAGISPFGLEFRPGSEKIGLRVNVVSLTYSNNDENNIFRISAMPTLSVCFRF